ncbi:hypothetical protein [Tomitella biformata]|uniref:hypothetical protein n=1 Tax=Tomitella biformata TaxID=630403 RepID=UPI0004667887|nr:hypothetical protein [Tomitella biformata]
MSTPPEPGLPAEPTPEPGPAPSRPAWWLPAIIAGGALAALAVTAVLVLTLRGPETFSLTGTLSINAASTEGPLPEGFACAGAGPLADIQPNLRVIVADGRHELVGKGELISSFAGGPDVCVFALAVHNVPRDRAEYLVQLSHRGEAAFSQDEAVAGIELTING